MERETPASCSSLPAAGDNSLNLQIDIDMPSLKRRLIFLAPRNLSFAPPYAVSALPYTGLVDLRRVQSLRYGSHFGQKLLCRHVINEFWGGHAVFRAEIGK